MRKHALMGFTMVELLVVIGIIGILSAIAVPLYKNYIMTANRNEARSVILQLVQILERNYTEAGVYNADTNSNTLSLPISQAPITGTAAYTMSWSLSASTYSITATPTNNQIGDICGSLSIDQWGNKTVTNGTAGSCWGG